MEKIELIETIESQHAQGENIICCYNDNVLYSTDSLLAFPVVRGMLCLLDQNAALAAYFMVDFYDFREDT